MKTPLVSGSYLLEKFAGKGGWTYIALPEIPNQKNFPFGWMLVDGTVDTYPLHQHKLMPQGNGHLMLSVNASIRKAIQKQAGDTVQLELYRATAHAEVPQEILDCLAMESKTVQDNFTQLPAADKQQFMRWIYEAKTEDTKAKRIVAMMNQMDH